MENKNLINRVKELRENGVALAKAIKIALKEHHCKYCKYISKIYAGECYCAAYSKSKRPDGKWWGHFPKCSGRNCPLKHPELLDGAKLDMRRK